MPYLPELVAVLEQHGELQLDAQTKTQVLSLSPATADRLLRAERQRHRPHGLGTTKPGTLLKHQIPIRTFADWDDAVPGFVEVDLVAHCAESTHGGYLHSLTLTDITTTWTECLALRNRSQHTVHAAIVQARTRLPFPLVGLDSDNGTEANQRPAAEILSAGAAHLYAQPSLQEERSSACGAEELVDRAANGGL